MRKVPYTLAVVFCISALLAGCNLPFLAKSQDDASVQTAAAQTVQAALATAAPPTATFTRVPFPTIPALVTTEPAATQKPVASATSSCDNADFVSDVTIPDNTPIGAGDGFSKTWRLKNAGDCSWTTSYAVVFLSGTSMDGPAVQALTGNVNSGQTVDITVDLTAPEANGTYTGNWGLRNGAGVIFSHFYVQIVVNDGTGGPFAVTRVTYTMASWSDSTHTNCPRITAAITTNAAGTVTYHWIRSDGADSTKTLVFSAAGMQSINYDWALASSHAGETNFAGLYIDSPNHQDFGRQSFTTACTSP
jgi:hypothetical protein